MEKIIIDKFSAYGSCDLFHHGKSKDSVEIRNFELKPGCLYGFIGELGNGGAALSCGLTGNIDYYHGEIYIDNQKTSIEFLIDISWYIGNDLYSNKLGDIFHIKPRLSSRSIINQIENGIKKGKCNLDSRYIQDGFNLSSERIRRNIRYTSGERWKMSAAIGFANGKRLFCYPWLNSYDINHLSEQISATVNFLLSHDCIVLIPTTCRENIQRVDSYGKIIYI